MQSFYEAALVNLNEEINNVTGIISNYRGRVEKERVNLLRLKQLNNQKCELESKRMHDLQFLVNSSLDRPNYLLIFRVGREGIYETFDENVLKILQDYYGKKRKLNG